MNFRRILKLFLKIIRGSLTIIIIFLISFFLNYKQSIIFGTVVAIIGLAVFIIGLKGIVKLRNSEDANKRYRYIDICITGLILGVLICVIEYRNINILTRSNKSLSVYKVLKDFKDEKKNMEEYNKLFKTTKHEKSTIYYASDVEAALGVVYKYLDKAELDTTKIFGNIKNEPLTIKFDYDKKVFKALKATKADYAGLYNHENKRINIFVSDCYEDILGLNMKNDAFKHYLLHEYSHYKLDEYINSNNMPRASVPAWFDEGIAEYIGFQGPKGDRPENLIDFSELNDPKDWEKYYSEKNSVYEQAHYAVSKLISLKGEKAIQQILLKTKESTFEDAFKSIVGVSIEEYQKQLQQDMNNGWKQYDKMASSSSANIVDNATRIKCLEAYAEKNTKNINALLDAETLYQNLGEFEKAKEKCVEAVKRDPNSTLAWYRVGTISLNLCDFKTAAEAYEKSISLDRDNAAGYIVLAQVLILTDIDRAAEMAEQAKKLEKSNFMAKQAQQIINLKSAVNKGNPYDAALTIIKNDSITSKQLKKAIIGKYLKEYPDVNNSARIQLEKIYKTL